MKIVAYHRVSTARQGASGLGLQAQTMAIEDFANTRNSEVIGSFTEVGSGKYNARPELQKALPQQPAASSSLSPSSPTVKR